MAPRNRQPEALRATSVHNGRVPGPEDEVVELLHQERDRLEALATALLERETLDQIEAYEVAGVPPADAEAADADPTATPAVS